MITKITALMLPLLSGLLLNAQTGVTDSATFAKAAYNTINVYHNYLGDQAGLYNGPQYLDYRHTITSGIPFLDTTRATNGSVVYNGILYENVPLLLDVLKQKLTTVTPKTSYAQELVSERISAFDILGHRFVKLPAANRNLQAGFYEILFEGKKNRIYKKHSKEIVEDLSGQRVLLNLLDKNSYYLYLQNKFHLITTKRSLLNAYGEHRRELKSYLRKSKFNFRKKEDIQLKELATFYDNL